MIINQIAGTKCIKKWTDPRTSRQIKILRKEIEAPRLDSEASEYDRACSHSIEPEKQLWLDVKIGIREEFRSEIDREANLEAKKMRTAVRGWRKP